MNGGRKSSNLPEIRSEDYEETHEDTMSIFFLNMVLCIYLVMGFLLYGLYFNITWPFSPHNHYIVEVVMAILRVYLGFAVLSLTFPGLSKLPCALYIPLKAPNSLENN